MPHSDDDFGIDDDDTELLHAATQFEVTPAAAFDPSPRPNKKRRLSPTSTVPPPSGLSDVEEDYQSPLHSSNAFQSTATPVNGNEATPTPQNADDSGEDYIYFPGELGEQADTRNSKYKIHIPENGGRFPDLIFTQTQHGLDEDPAKFRGAIWKRPPVNALLPGVGDSAHTKGSSIPVMRPSANGISNYFHAVRRPTAMADDAALAARLQAGEDAFLEQNALRMHPPTNLAQPRFAAELDDLPSDAFSSSSPEKSPAKEFIELSSQILEDHGSQQQAPARRAPQTGLKQMTMFGKAATQQLTTSQAANKRHAWPLMQTAEPPTHHKLDIEAMKSWVYPTNLGTIRDYQFNIVSRSLFHNTLVALPTGLGKTFIAATVMLNYYRWAPNAQLIFMAPTKPLIAQQMEACYGIVGIPRRDTILMTGETSPALRTDQWLEKRVFFMTPQTVINDLKTGICDPKRIVLLVVDEAHKATGGYAYTEVVSFLRRFNSSFRVLALTATPGSSVEAVQAVIDNLGVARVELRTEQSIDITEYTHEKQTETEVFAFSDEQSRVMELISKALRPAVDKLSSQNAYWSKDPMNLSAFGLTKARQTWMASEAGRKAPIPVKGMMNALFTVLSSLAHSIMLLKFHGISPFYSGMLGFQRKIEGGEMKGKTALGISQSEHFTKMMSELRTWTNNPDFIGHPKLEYLREVVLNHFLDAGEGRQGSDVPPSSTRVMVFSSYRDSTEDICRILKRNEPMIRPHVFVGQSASKGSEGMDQKKQNAVIQDFKSGKYNTLVATSIGEEGLDIGTVDLIVCYDASSSPIRMLQRIGRTGRKRVGRVVLLLTEKEERDYAKAQDNYIAIQRTIADEKKYLYRDDQSPRILPKEVRPVADKRPVEIPIENSQPIDLNEKGRKARGKARTKRPPKKFNMPDGVRTGFVKASRIDSDDDNSSDSKKQKKSAKRKQPRAKDLKQPLSRPQVEVAQLPYLGDILLKPTQEEELQRRFARTVNADGDDVIRPPDAYCFPAKFRDLGPVKDIHHGSAARLVQKTMTAIHNATPETIHRQDDIRYIRDPEDAGAAACRLVSPPADEISSPEMVTKSFPALSRRKEPPERPKLEDPHIQLDESRSDSDLPAAPMPAPPPPLSKKPRGRPKKKIERAVPYGSTAGEGAESSPDPTPADMRIGTQGIDLGSRDTSGEDDNEEPDSELEEFIANTSDPIELVSSSQSGTQAARKAPINTKSDDARSEGSAEEGEGEITPVVVKRRQRRVIAESDDDE